MDVVGEASDWETALASAQLLAPDVIGMDCLLICEVPEAIKALRQLPQNMGVLLLASADSQECLELAIATGARGYMLKNSTPSQLVAGFRQAATTDDKDPRGLSRLVPDLQALARTEQSYARTSPLTIREQEVMMLLAEGRTVREVASELSLSIKTIEAHKLNLMRKLDIHNRASLVDYAVRVGLVSAQPVNAA
jgi:DNA-binding NarL/FixJ family response regulator